jgi:signal peptidase I
MNPLYHFYLRQKAKKAYFQALKMAKTTASYLSPEDKALVKSQLESFQNQLLTQNPPLDRKTISHFKNFHKEKLELKGSKKWKHFFLTTSYALLIACAVRQMWFELYKVPTGSMRPTIKELDHLTVSKLNFSLNVPFTPKHFYFDPDLVKRSSICVFTSENMDVADSDTRYFFLFPGKKLLVKRLIAKPGDTIYFYGGKIFGIDKNGHDITSELSSHNISLIDHIPFIQWQGEKETLSNLTSNTLYHMNAPFISYDKSGSWDFTIPSHLRNENAKFGQNPNSPWGLENFATARVLNTRTKHKLYPNDPTFSPKGLYLELRHNPQISKDLFNQSSSPLALQTSLIPLDENLGKKLFNNLYTARFEVKNGALKRYGASIPFTSKQLPHLHHIPDGTYEFYYGKAYQVVFGGTTKLLDQNHPIYRYSATALEVFFNLGIDFTNYFVPGDYQDIAPPRYSYFNRGDLYVMGLGFLSSSDPELTSFIAQEKKKQLYNPSYKPFMDLGAPINSDGSLDKEKIAHLGLKIPEKMYFVLGDNHAQSADSRVFGFVPENNLKGCPKVIFWPFGSRFGELPQATGPSVTLPRSLVWSAAWVITIIWLKQKKKREVFPQDLSLLDS